MRRRHVRGEASERRGDSGVGARRRSAWLVNARQTDARGRCGGRCDRYVLQHSWVSSARALGGAARANEPKPLGNAKWGSQRGRVSLNAGGTPGGSLDADADSHCECCWVGGEVWLGREREEGDGTLNWAGQDSATPSGRSRARALRLTRVHPASDLPPTTPETPASSFALLWCGSSKEWVRKAPGSSSLSIRAHRSGRWWIASRPTCA